MSRTKMQRIISILLLLYFFVIFYYGIIIKITFPNSILFGFKTLVPELILFVICFIIFIDKKHKVDRSSFYMLIIIVVIIFINFFTSFSLPSILMTIRDVFIPIITGFFLTSIEITEKELKWFFSKLSLLCAISLIIGFVLGLAQYLNGWEWTSAWYTGYPFWGEDERSSMFIMTSGGHVRVPSITGHNVKFGMYSFFQFIIIFFLNRNINKKTAFINAVFCFLMFVNVYISNNKTTIVILVMLILISIINKFDIKSKLKISVIVVLLGICFYFGVLESSNFMLSFYDRFSKWSVLFQPNLLKNIIIPISTYNFAGNSITNIPVLNYWDNTYLYFLFSFGLIGMTAIIVWIRSMYDSVNVNYIQMIKYLTIFTMIASFTTSIVLGRCFFNIYIIILSYVSFCFKKQKDTRYFRL